MDRRNFLLSGTVLVSAVTARAQDKSANLEVQVSYTGSGPVDESHKVYVVLWDNPNFVTEEAGAPPIDLKRSPFEVGVRSIRRRPNEPGVCEHGL